MSPPSGSDPFTALWQAAPKPDTQQLLRVIAKQRRLHWRLNATLAAILTSVTVLLVSVEMTARLATHGWLSGAWLGCLAVGLLWRYRAQCRRVDMADKNTVDLLRSMARQAGTDLFLARCLWAGVPIGAMLGALGMRSLSLRPEPVAAPGLSLVQTVAAMTILGGMILAGLLLARSRKVQLRELNEKLKSIATEQ